MTTDIFIRTYAKDKEFLAYSLMSIAKFVSGYNHLILVIPEEDEMMLTEMLNEYDLGRFKKPDGKPIEVTTYRSVKRCENGYIDQQISKLLAYQNSGADNILFVDSDCIFTKPTDLSEFFIDDKPFLLRSMWENVGDAVCWREVTERILGFETQYEHMRRLPMMLKRHTLENFAQKHNILDFAALDRLSEFNLLGAYADKFESEHYHIISTETDAVPEPVAKQFWSWSGLTEDEKVEIEAILK